MSRYEEEKEKQKKLLGSGRFSGDIYPVKKKCDMCNKEATYWCICGRGYCSKSCENKDYSHEY